MRTGRSRRLLLVPATGLLLLGTAVPAVALDASHVLPAATTSLPGAIPQYVPLTPDRILDTRLTHQPVSGSGYSGTGPLQAGVVYTLDLTKTTVPTDAGALAVNVTAVGPAGAGNLRIGPSCGGGAPGTSLVNYQPGKDIANYVVVPLQCSTNTAPVPALTIYSAGASTGVTLDLTGYDPTYDGSTGVPGGVPPPPTGTYTPGFTAVTPYRAVDTRDGTGSPMSPIAAGTSRAFQIGGSAALIGATAVALNVTSVAQPGQGNLRVYPDGGAVPTTSNVNYIPGVDKAGFVVVQVPADGKIDVYAAGAPDEVVIDVFGYYSVTSTLVSSAPTRILDTRTSSAAQGLPSPLAANKAYTAQVSGRGGVPAGALAALLSVTAINPGGSGLGNLRVFAGGTALPNVSNINYLGSAYDVANFVIAPLSSSGTISLYSAGSPVNVSVDVLGYVPAAGTTT